MAYLIVLFMPIKTTEAKYRCTKIFFLEWPLIHFLLLLFFLRTLSCCRLAVYVCSGGDVCRYRSRFKRGGGGETGLYSPTEVQVIFEMPQLLFQLQRADNEWLSTRGD